MRCANQADLGLRILPFVRLGSLRVTPRQLPLFSNGSDTVAASVTARRGTRFTELRVRSILNAPEQTKMGFWSVNPYVGCEFGCTYCYARPTHRYVVERTDGGLGGGGTRSNDAQGDPGQAFEERIFVKQGAGAVLMRTLRPDRIGRQPILIGTATDPYQPAEKMHGITRSLLESIARFRDLDIGIITKSPLITRDIDLLRAIGSRSRLVVRISLMSTDAQIIRTFEARSPAPAARLKALQRLRKARIETGVIMAPVLPGITDDTSALDALMRAATQAGGTFVEVVPLRMYDECRGRFMRIVHREYPHLVPRYERAFSSRRTVPRVYRKALSERTRRLRAKYGLARSPAAGTSEATGSHWSTPDESHPQLFAEGGV